MEEYIELLKQPFWIICWITVVLVIVKYIDVAVKYYISKRPGEEEKRKEQVFSACIIGILLLVAMGGLSFYIKEPETPSSIKSVINFGFAIRYKITKATLIKRLDSAANSEAAIISIMQTEDPLNKPQDVKIKILVSLGKGNVCLPYEICYKEDSRCVRKGKFKFFYDHARRDLVIVYGTPYGTPEVVELKSIKKPSDLTGDTLSFEIVAQPVMNIRPRIDDECFVQIDSQFHYLSELDVTTDTMHKARYHQTYQKELRWDMQGNTGKMGSTCYDLDEYFKELQAR